MCGLLNGMVNSGGEREAGEWSEMGPHEEFLELCAVSTSGDLTEEEQNKLKAHLAGCAECRQALKGIRSCRRCWCALASVEVVRCSFRRARITANGTSGRSARCQDMRDSGAATEVAGVLEQAMKRGVLRSPEEWPPSARK